jgi:hypothetical protein
MKTLDDNLVPDELRALVAPLLPAHRGRPTAADTAPSPTGPAWLRSWSWPAPRRRGGCCLPASWAAARQRPAGAGSPNGPTPACSTPSILWSWTAWLSRAGWSGNGRARTPWVRANVGDQWAQLQSIVASLEASCTWSATAAGLPPDRGGDHGQPQRHHRVPGPRGGHLAGPDAGGAAAHPTRRGSC